MLCGFENLLAQFAFALICSKTSIAKFAIVLCRFENRLAQFVVAFSQLKKSNCAICGCTFSF